MLVEEYNAYEIPLYTKSRTDYTNDEEVREDLIETLLTITDPRTLTLIDPDWADADPATVDEYWREIFIEYPEEDDYPWTHGLLTTQHALGHRISVVLEREGDYATGFKVYGVGVARLVDRLAALIGHAPPRPNDHPDREYMRVGDINDDAFAQYLRRLEAEDMI
ncbi:hypothetical protein [Microbacterium flavescens]|uniref:hypothetical protein n=1 Tax=Microbacterium flavescens TaxID=69366 RepID=UPI001BDEFABF|nr:hypothetical protein [Microbacterium flavescens]BFF09216.1 hypothetical protein GCM10025699_05190 [Microbacterium flavescens]